MYAVTKNMYDLSSNMTSLLMLFVLIGKTFYHIANQKSMNSLNINVMALIHPKSSQCKSFKVLIFQPVRL